MDMPTVSSTGGFIDLEKKSGFYELTLLQRESYPIYSLGKLMSKLLSFHY